MAGKQVFSFATEVIPEIVNLERLGNTSAASVPLALDEHLRNGTIRAGSRVLVIGFGGGLSWGGLLMRC